MRAILFASMAHGASTISAYLQSSDTDAMIRTCQIFGATIKQFDTKLEVIGIDGCIQYASDIIHAGNSGIILRFCAALGANCKNPVVITGDHSICHQRPMHELLKGLRQLGVSVLSLRGDDYAPLILQGPLLNSEVCIQGEDSQFVSALLIASAFAAHPITIKVENPGEKPWVGLTLDWFERLQIPYRNQDFCEYEMQGNASYKGFNYSVPGDFSSAAFPIAAAIITRSEIVLSNLNFQDAQGDKKIITILEEMGASFEFHYETFSLKINKVDSLKGIEIDVNDVIDAFPILAIIGCFAKGKTVLKNAKIARSKECDRIHVMSQELSKMGAKIIEKEDSLIIFSSQLTGAEVDSHQDHRVAMALAVAGLGASGMTRITNTACINKTYSSFVKDFQTLGAIIEYES